MNFKDFLEKFKETVPQKKEQKDYDLNSKEVFLTKLWVNAMAKTYNSSLLTDNTLEISPEELTVEKQRLIEKIDLILGEKNN